MTTETIISTICEEFGITPDMLKVRSRREPLPTARALIAHFLYRELGMFPRDILPLTGHPLEKRTAVYHYLGRKTLIERNVPFDKSLRQKVDNIRERLEQDSRTTADTWRETDREEDSIDKAYIWALAEIVARRKARNRE